METMVSKNGINFNELEKELFRIGCEIALGIMRHILGIMDITIRQGRDKKRYRHKGKRKRTIKTIMGELTFERAVYETKLENGQTACIYLLDEALGFDTVGNVSTNLATEIAGCVCVSSYREAAKGVSSMTGQTISHGGVWNIIQRLGKKQGEVEEKQAEQAKTGRGKGEIIARMLFEEADGVWINMQKKYRPAVGKKREMKVAVAYDGWVQEGKNRYHLSNKVLTSGFCNSKDFQENKEGAIAAVFNTDEIQIRILNGDGGGWIKEGLTDEDVHFQLDPFHKNREITRRVRDKDHRATIKRLLTEKKVDLCLEYIEALSESIDDEKERENLKRLYGYFSNNREGLIPYQERGLNLPAPPEGMTYRTLGTMEHQVGNTFARRMKRRNASWSIKGAENLGRLLCKKASDELHETVTSLSRMVLPDCFSGEITAILSAAKAPIKDGTGYQYPVRGREPFQNTLITNGRKAILNMLRDRVASELIYR